MGDYSELGAALRQHRGSDAAETAAVGRFLELLRGENPADREAYAPGHLTASAVVRSEAGRALLIFHPKLQRWLQPGGHVEPGEFDLRESARRELREETGLELPVTAFEMFDLDIHEIPASAKHPAHLHFDIRYLARVASETLAGTAVDACDARWFSEEELATVARADGGLRRMAAKLRLVGGKAER